MRENGSLAFSFIVTVPKCAYYFSGACDCQQALLKKQLKRTNQRLKTPMFTGDARHCKRSYKGSACTPSSVIGGEMDRLIRGFPP